MSGRRAARVVAVVAVVAALVLAGVACGGRSLNSPEALRELAGKDADGNGVRDDVDVRIVELTKDPDMAAYLTEVARNSQEVMTFNSDASDARARAFTLASRTNELVSCPPGGDGTEGRRLGDEVEAAVANTGDRKAKLDELSRLIDGRVFYQPDCAKVDAPAAGSADPATAG